MDADEAVLENKDKALIRVFMAAAFHRWELLPVLGSSCYAAGCTISELRGCIRHLIVICGYGPCLAATLHLHKHKLLPEDRPGKVGGPPGNAFELVYAGVTDKVREKMHSVDPVLGEYIRLHLYGDIYSSPGLSLRQKQLLMVSFLSEANMHDQLFGHLLAALRFGAGQKQCLKAIDIAFELAPKPSNAVYKGAMKTLAMAYKKFVKDQGGSPLEVMPDVVVPDPESVRLPPLPELYNVGKQALDAVMGGHDLESMLEETEMDSVTFAWDSLPVGSPNKKRSRDGGMPLR